MRNRPVEACVKSYLGANPETILHGNVTGTTIDLAPWKFVDEPTVLLSPISVSGTPTATVIKKSKDSDGYYTSVTISSSADSVDFVVIGRGINA